VQKKLSTSVPEEVLRRYEKWKTIAQQTGPAGVQAINGCHDEALYGQWNGYRSARLGRQWRLIYQVISDALVIQVVEVNAHVYKKH
jgi:addiction module RelE/StbE family toxin